jgi:hypothetical protein
VAHNLEPAGAVFQDLCHVLAHLAQRAAAGSAGAAFGGQVLDIPPRQVLRQRAAATTLSLLLRRRTAGRLVFGVTGAGCGSAVESAADGSTPGAPAVQGGAVEVLGVDDLAQPADTAEPLHPVTKPIVDLEALPAARR